MPQVTSPTCRATGAGGARWARRVLTAAAATALTLGLAAPGARAADDELRARQQQVRSAVQAAQVAVQADEEALGAASEALLAAQNRLAEAQAKLSDTQVQLASAREQDARLASELQAARAQLARDEADVAEAQARVDDQQALIVQAAREAYQQRSDLSGIEVVLGSDATGDYAQRVQWDTTVFDTSQARLDALTVLRGRLQAARDAQAATAARVAAAKATSARTVTRIAALVKQAQRLQQEVAGLVAQADAARQAAQAELDAEQARYDQLLAEDEQVSRALAEQAAADLAAGLRYVTSAQGFIRPVAAAPGSAFGLRFHPILKVWRAHRGTDFGAACGTPLYAAQAGRVQHVGPQGGFGNYTVINHGVIGGKAVMTGYAHQQRWVVSLGERVERGQLIGYVGTTGLSTGCHLHLQVYVNGTPVNPMTWIP